MRRVLAGLVSLLLFGAVFAKAAPPTVTQQVTPGTMSYQGRLQTNDGVVYTNGIYTVDFKLYDAGTAGTLLWGATYKPYVNNGFFTVILGQTGVGESANTNATYTSVEEFWKGVWIDPNASGKKRFLGITVHEDEHNNAVPSPAESFPRQELQVAPFAIQAQFAVQSSGDFKVSGNLNTDNDITSGGKLTVPEINTAGGSLVLKPSDYVDIGGIGSFGHTSILPSGQPEGGDLIVSDDLYVDDRIMAGGMLSAVGLQPHGDDSLQIKGHDETGYIDMRGDTVFYGDAWLKPGYKLRMDNHEIQYIAEAPHSGMRMIAGTVNASGSEIRDPGDKYYVSRESEGRYKVTFRQAFSSSPVVLVTVDNDANSFDNFISTDGVYAGYFYVEGRDDQPGEQATYQDTPFNFIVVGY